MTFFLSKTNLIAGAFLLVSQFIQGQDQEGFPLSNLDKNADPCTNFYQFAAAGWMQNNPMPETESRWGSFNILAKQNDVKIKLILEGAAKTPGLKGSQTQLVGDFYSSALDTNTLNKLAAKPLKSIIKKINRLKSPQDIAKLTAELRPLGIGGLFSFYVGIDAKDSEKHRVHLGQGGLGLPDRDYYLNTDEASERIRQAYVAHIDAMFKLAGIRENKAGARILAMETELAKISMTRVERRDPDKTYNKYQLEDFYKQPEWSAFPWEVFFTTLQLNTFDALIVSQPAFLKGMVELLDKYKTADWKLYFKWQALNDASNILSGAIERESFSFYQGVLSGTRVMKPRWERSVHLVNGNLGETLGQLFVQKHFSPESKMKVSELVENLREAFAERIDALDWMSPATKKQAMKKLGAFNYKIGYPDKWKDYSMVEIKKNTLYQNVQNVNRRKFELMVAKIGQPIDKDEWGMTPQTVNAYYSASRNEIVFPAGILQPPFYNPNADDAVNYGAIGAVIGHEFSHGFDDKGSKFDDKGNLKNWWTAEDRAKFEARTAKIVAQYSRFEVLDSVYVNGALTQGENIADLAGLTMAYYDLKASYNKKGVPDLIDGFNWQQRFFLGWTHVWSQNISEKELRRRILTDSHSPGKERVLGPLANMPEFWEAFGCTPGNPMVAPEEVRVVLW
jgi:putative endopeptidase